MPGPALNPIANTAPVASLKAATGTRPDASADSGKTEAPEQGFASELKRQMRGESGPDEAASHDAKAAAASDEAAKPTDDAAQDQAPTAPADLSALLAGAAAAANAAPALLPDGSIAQKSISQTLLLRGAVIDPIPLAKVTDQTFAAIESVEEDEDE